MVVEHANKYIFQEVKKETETTKTVIMNISKTVWFDLNNRSQLKA